MEAIDLVIRPVLDPAVIDSAIRKLEALEKKGFTIPVNFAANLEALKTDAEAVIGRIRGQWQSLSSDLSGANSKLLQELDRLGESTAAARLRRGFASVREEVLVLDNLISQLNFKGDPGAGLAKGLAGARIADLVKSGQSSADKVSFAGYGEQAEKATVAREAFTAAEKQGIPAAAQSEAAIAAESAALKAKAGQFEAARVSAEKFQKIEEQHTATTQKAGRAAKESADAEAGLIRSRYENGKLATQTFARGAGTTEQISGSETSKTIDRLKMARSESEALNFEMKSMVATQKAQGASASALNQTYATFAKKLEDVAAKYKDIERTGQTSIGRQAAAARSFGGNAIAQEEARVQQQQRASQEALQRQRSQALIRQAKEEERSASSTGLKGIMGIAGSAATFIGVYHGIDLVIRALRAGAEASVEFERKLATLSVIFNGTKEEARALAIETLKTAAAFGQDGIAALEVAKDFARFGGTQVEVLEAVRVVAQAANVAEIDLAETSKYFQAIMAGGSLQAGQLAAVLGMLNTISNTYNVTVKQLLEGLARVAPLAKQAGISLAELSGFEAVISGRTSRPGAEAGNALKSLISRLAKPEIQGALGDAGISVTDQAGGLKSTSQVINELFLAYQRLGSAEREELLIKVAGTQQAARIAALLDGYITSQELAIRASRDLTSSDRENIAVRETLSSQLGTLKTRWEEFWVAGSGAGQASGLQSGLTNIVKLLSNLLSGLTLAETGLGKLAGGADTGLKATLGKTTGGVISQAFGDIFSPIRTINRELAQAGAGFQEIFGDKLKTDTEIAAEGLQKFNSEVEKLQNLGKADEIASQLLKTIAKLAETAAPDKLAKMIQVAATVVAPGDLPQQEAIRAQLTDLAKAGNFVAFNNRLAEFGLALDKDRAANLAAATDKLSQFIAQKEKELQLEMQLRDAAAKKNDQAGVDDKDKRIKAMEFEIEALKNRRSGAFTKEFSEEEAGTGRGQEMIKQQEIAFRRLKNSADAYGEAVKAIPTLTRGDELTSEMQVLDVKMRLLELEKMRMEAALKTGQISVQEKTALQENLGKEIDAVNAAKEKVREQMRYAEVLEAIKRASTEAQAATERFGIGSSPTEKLASTIRGLTGPARPSDSLTGLSLNIASAQADFAGARNPVEQASALARIKEFGISLQGAENDLVRRRFQIEAEITNERRKQAEEASRNLLMADRETQLRAALAAKFAQQRGRGFSASEFQFFDPTTKQAIEKTNPDLLPPEFKNRLRELIDESGALTLVFRPLKEAADAAARAIAALNLPAPAINPQLNGSVVAPGIDNSAVAASIDASGHGVQVAIEVMGTKISGYFDAFSDALNGISGQLDFRISQLESGSATARIGRAQGAVSVLA